jgi:hypothetical protein
MATGQCGSVLGSHIFPLTEGPRYLFVLFSSSCCICRSDLRNSKGFGSKFISGPRAAFFSTNLQSLVCSRLSLCRALSGSLRASNSFPARNRTQDLTNLAYRQISYRRDNARRDKLYGKPDTRGRVDTAQLADKVGSTW